MKVLIIHNHYLNFGGEDAVVKSELEMLLDYGHDVLLYERSNKEFYRLTWIEKITLLARDLFWSFGAYSDVVWVLKRFKPDVVHFHNTFFVISPAAYFACLAQKIPVVQTLHNYRFICPKGVFFRDNMICEDCMKHGLMSAVRNRCVRKSFFSSFVYVLILRLFFMGRILHKGVCKFIALSEFSRSKFIQSGLISENKIVVKPNCLSEDIECRENIGDYVLFVGVLYPYKGVATLVEACNQLPDVKLNIIGTGPDYDSLQAKARNNKNIKTLGFKPFKETLDYIKHCAFVVAPSECYENFPRIIVEAFAYGVPVVASRHGALEEIVEDKKTGLLFDPKDVNDLAEKIRSLYHDKKLIKFLGQEARRVYEDKYRPEENYHKLMEIYNQTLKEFHGKAVDEHLRKMI